MELREAGLLTKADVGDELQASLRVDQWKLRDIKASNRARKNSLYSLIIGTELRRQAFMREHKKYMDETEITYLERMIKKAKKHKKARNKYPKLLMKMFKNYEQGQRAKPSAVGVVTPTGLSGGAGGGGAGAVSTAGVAGSPGFGARGRDGGIAGGFDDRSATKPKSAKKKRKRSDSRPPTSKSAANKGKQHTVDDSDTL